MIPAKAVHPNPPAPRGQSATARRARIVSGGVLFAFVTTHLVNHALGLVSLDAMESGRQAFLALWRNPAGNALLGLAVLVHVGLAYYAIYLRRSLRMPVAEAVQLLLGLTVPVLLVGHTTGTLLAAELHGFRDSYTYLLLVFHELRPDLGLKQSALVTVAWVHGCIGMHYWLRPRAWYARRPRLFYTAAVLLPVLALAGFAAGGREVTVMARDPGFLRATQAEARVPAADAQAELGFIGDLTLGIYAALLAATLGLRAWRLARERRGSVQVTYPGGRTVSMPLGLSILECSRMAGIAHASVCGGRGRCSTCRVRVIAGHESLPPAASAEARLLERVGAGRQVRLACQLRPVAHVAVVPLIPPTVEPEHALVETERMSGEERDICVLFADLRGFTRLSEKRLPYDVVFLLNRYFEAAGGAIDAAGGITNQFTGDGVMALFGVYDGAAAGARQALAAARAMTRAVAALSTELREELPEPLRIGIGIHCGPTVVGHMGRGVATYLTAVGDAVNTASRLQDQTKAFACQLVVSEQVAQRAGVDLSSFPAARVSVRNRDASIAIRIVADVEALPLPADIPKGNPQATA